jgi:hypothetical protein
MKEKKYYLLNDLKEKYNIAEDGTVTNKNAGKILKYSKHKGQEFVSLYINKKSYQYTKLQLQSFLSGEYNKKNRCKICDSWCSEEICNICCLKLKCAKELIIKVKGKINYDKCK